MRVVLSTEKLSAYAIAMAIVGHLQAANASVQAGNFSDNNQEVRVDAGISSPPRGSGSCGGGVVRGHPVYLRDVADKIVDGAAEPSTMWSTDDERRQHSVADSAPVSGRNDYRAKRKGTNATDISMPCSSVCMRCRA